MNTTNGPVTAKYDGIDFQASAELWSWIQQRHLPGYDLYEFEDMVRKVRVSFNGHITRVELTVVQEQSLIVADLFPDDGCQERQQWSWIPDRFGGHLSKVGT